VDAVGGRFGFEIIVADGEEVYYWLGSRLNPLPCLVEVDDLARVALLPETSQGDLNAFRRNILLVSLRYSLQLKKFCSHYHRPVEAINGLPFYVDLWGKDLGLPDDVEDDCVGYQLILES
jgi:hypothetical protein